MKKSVNMHVSKRFIEYLWLSGGQISKIEEMNNEYVGWGNIMLEDMMERIFSSVIFICNANFLLWRLWVAVT